MHEDHRGAPVELVYQFVEVGVAEVAVAAAGGQGDTVELEGIEGVSQFCSGRVDVGQGQDGEGAEAARIVPDKGSRVFVAFTRQVTCEPFIPEIDAGSGDGGDGGGYVVLVHDLERTLGGPWRKRCVGRLAYSHAGKSRKISRR